MFKRLKNIEDNLVKVDNNDNKVGFFKIINDIKNKGIKIDNDNKAIIEIRKRIKKLTDDGLKVNNPEEIKEKITEHIQNLKMKNIDDKINKDQINDLIDEIFDKRNIDDLKFFLI